MSFWYIWLVVHTSTMTLVLFMSRPFSFLYLTTASSSEGMKRQMQTVNQPEEVEVYCVFPLYRKNRRPLALKRNAPHCELLFTCLCVKMKDHLTFAQSFHSSHPVPASLGSSSAIETHRYRHGGASKPVITCLLPQCFMGPSHYLSLFTLLLIAHLITIGWQ